jgi:hypothetical protein
LFGSRISWNEANLIWTKRIAELGANTRDFQFHLVQRSPVVVGFAKHAKAFDLRWGTTTDEILISPGAKRLNLVSVNKETHIVA